MRRAALAASVALAALAVPAMAQESDAVYQQQSGKAYRFAGDALARYEWTRDVLEGGVLEDENRYFLEARPRVEVRVGPVELGVGGAFRYSDVRNDVPSGDTPLTIIRDNFRSRDARLDLAWAKVTLGPVALQGGRFRMPIPFTEMIWDRDLRPQGGAVSINFAPKESFNRFALHGIYATGSHVFEDKSAMYGGGLELRFGSSQGSSVQLVGTYLQFEDLDRLDPLIQRQNAHVGAHFTNDYRVVDLVARLTRGGQLPVQLVGDYCWNTALDSNNRGLWLAAVLGDLTSSRARAEYTYSKIDREATVSAFDADDFYWGTGWEGHRADLGTGVGKGSEIHAVAQWQRFKDSPSLAVQENWVKRYRLEWRMKF
ncbi:MAG TPA: putative porin [Vicinamibacteria bacterium]|nr:putative porin [Vicinamibacteria bacterium]